MIDIHCSMKSFSLSVLIVLICFACINTTSKGQTSEGRITPASERTQLYLPQLEGKKIGVIVNQTSTVQNLHLVDFLTKYNFKVVKIFAPEHGFRGKADAGELISDGKDTNTGIDIISLYGKNKKPKATDLADIDILIFDIQDVGVRFYTYISTLHYVMEAAAENNVPLIVLDRPNPLSQYIDGPVLEDGFSSFVGKHKVPVVYGMTIGEYALMINGEGWLPNNLKANLKVIEIENYTHDSSYILPIKPSPNLPNNIAIGHYPSLCFFEGTTVSVGRGTSIPFQQVGHPSYKGDHSFTPVSTEGAKYPKHENKLCHGLDLSRVKPSTNQLDLGYLIEFYNKLKAQGEPFFNDDNFFNLLAGTDKLKDMIIKGYSAEEIRALWQADILEFTLMRKKYLLYN